MFFNFRKILETKLPIPPYLRQSSGHVNQSSETTKSRNHFEKEQNQRFALQELLKQFLAMSCYITAISYQLRTNCGKAIAIVS